MYKPFLFFFRDAIDKGLLLVLGTVIAIILSNSNLANIYHAIVHSDLEISYISQNHQFMNFSEVVIRSFFENFDQLFRIVN
jgi:Na+/H+ antiporter NhaA